MIDDGLVVSVNGAAVEVFAIDGVTQILHRRQLDLHKEGVVAIKLMAHHRAVELKVRQLSKPLIIFIELHAVHRNAR